MSTVRPLSTTARNILAAVGALVPVVNMGRVAKGTIQVQPPLEVAQGV